MAGYIATDVANQPESVLTTLQILFIYSPLVLSAITIILLRFYTLEKIYPDIIKELAQRTHNVY